MSREMRTAQIRKRYIPPNNTALQKRDWGETITARAVKIAAPAKLAKNQRISRICQLLLRAHFRAIEVRQITLKKARLAPLGSQHPHRAGSVSPVEPLDLSGLRPWARARPRSHRALPALANAGVCVARSSEQPQGLTRQRVAGLALARGRCSSSSERRHGPTVEHHIGPCPSRGSSGRPQGPHPSARGGPRPCTWTVQLVQRTPSRTDRRAHRAVFTLSRFLRLFRHPIRALRNIPQSRKPAILARCCLIFTSIRIYSNVNV